MLCSLSHDAGGKALLKTAGYYSIGTKKPGPPRKSVWKQDLKGKRYK